MVVHMQLLEKRSLNCTKPKDKKHAWSSSGGVADAHAPKWTALSLAQYQVDHEDEQAVESMHVVLRNEPLHAMHWVAMGHVYHHFGKEIAAHRSHLRAMALGESGWQVLVLIVQLEARLDLYDEAIVHIQQPQVHAQVDEEALSMILYVIAKILYQQALILTSEGFYGRAAVNLHKALDALSGLAPHHHVLKLREDLYTVAVRALQQAINIK
jgi:tetratricopeptide (TPR) repeat protein